MIGVDGMDPGFVERHWNALPNLDRLRKRGSFRRLRTTMPPQSPVAWSTFITGLSPNEHGIFDFVHRNAATRAPYSSMDKTEEPRFVLPLVSYRIPLSGSRVISLRRGKAFWEMLTEHQIPATVIRMPTNYPPIQAGKALSGMGTPDLSGTTGTFTFYTSDSDQISRSMSGGRVVKVAMTDGHVVLSISGPENPLRKDHAESSAELIVDVDARESVARISSGGFQVILREGEWSGWIPLEFQLIPHLVSAHGMVRVFAKQLHASLALYVSPVNVDPVSPSLPISAPASYAHNVAAEIGRFYTLGIPEDTAIFRQGLFEMPEFLSQTALVMEDEHKLLEHNLHHFQEGLLFFYFSSVDQNSHMLWGKHDAELLRIYQAVDESIGEVTREQPEAELMVMSDHGFAAFDRAVHLNTWLNNHGFQGRAYAMGLNGLYLNLSGREGHGTVQPGDEQRRLLEELRKQLLAFRDPLNGKVVVESVVKTHPSAANAGVAPDLIVGYPPGYRASWQTGLGEAGSAEIEDNVDAWIADHCINPDDVPGVLFTSSPVTAASPGLEDLSVSILARFGLPAGPEMRGRQIY